MLTLCPLARVFVLALASTALLSAACGGQRRAAASGAPTFTRLTLGQGACFGTCPVYDLDVYPDGRITYTGRQYAPYRGLHNGTVPPDTLAVLAALAQEVLAKADELPREIETLIMDYPHSRVAIATATDTIEFSGTTEFAPPVDRLRATLRRLAEEVEFVPDPSNKAPGPDSLRVTLRAADQIQVVQEEYYRQQLKVVRLERKDPPVFVVTFDPYTMSAEEMVRSLSERSEVVEVVPLR